jgi:hypothetical protein
MAQINKALIIEAQKCLSRFNEIINEIDKDSKPKKRKGKYSEHGEMAVAKRNLRIGLKKEK